MFTALLQWDTIQKIILNTIFVSIPEEFYWVMFTLILTGEFEYWKEEECKRLINKWDYSRILIPTLTVALLSNIFRYIGLYEGIFSIVPIIIFYILIVLTNDILGDASALKWLGKSFMFFLLGLITIVLSELLYIPFILYMSGSTLQEFNNNIFLNFIVSIPSRVIQYTILICFVARKRSLLKGNIFKHIISSPILSSLTSIVFFFDFLFLYIMYYAIVYEKVLVDSLPSFQVMIIVGVILFPILNILALVWGIYYVENRAVHKQKLISDKLSNLLNNVKLYTNNENYDNIKWKLNEIGIGIEEVADSLYQVKRRKGG